MADKVRSEVALQTSKASVCVAYQHKRPDICKRRKAQQLHGAHMSVLGDVILAQVAQKAGITGTVKI